MPNRKVAFLKRERIQAGRPLTASVREIGRYIGYDISLDLSRRPSKIRRAFSTPKTLVGKVLERGGVLRGSCVRRYTSYALSLRHAGGSRLKWS